MWQRRKKINRFLCCAVFFFTFLSLAALTLLLLSDGLSLCACFSTHIHNGKSTISYSLYVLVAASNAFQLALCNENKANCFFGFVITPHALLWFRFSSQIKFDFEMLSSIVIKKWKTKLTFVLLSIRMI